MIHAQRLTRYIANGFLSGLALVWLAPVAIMLAIAFAPPDNRSTKFGGLVLNDISTKNFEIVLEDAPIFQHLFNSLFITLASVVFVILFGSMAAYAFARMKIRGKNVLFFLLITTLMLPVPTLIVPIFQINKSLGLLDSYFGLILPYTALGLPFAIIVLRGFFEALPKSLEEAATIDGVPQYKFFWFIALPLSWPALTVVVIFQFMTSFNEFVLALVTMDSDHLKPLSLVPLIYSGQFFTQPGAMFATLTIITVPVIVVYVVMQRFMIGGLTAGAEKG
ncbi:carbohydrate ABC transporter permease [Lentilitoribacter sp. EG35]|jgi:ABC-type glycerol-3-phosphate transport system permease component|uniref:carbohydrate ABC transporter permease n=1 Tax=Lentilitoribacter sp. EG35 TaxID=3234192 RepID=UPI0034607BD0